MVAFVPKTFQFLSMTTTRARVLRKDGSPSERRLWLRLKTLRERGFHFRKQVEKAHYIVDFACLAYRLVVEVDGAHHYEPAQAQHDAIRDAALERAGLTVLRLPASLVMRDMDGAMQAVMVALEQAGAPKWQSKLRRD
mgnify:CR=1 FL=1